MAGNSGDRLGAIEPTRRALTGAERRPLVAVGIVALLAGIAGGLLRLGWPTPVTIRAPIAPLHGPLMIAGFLGTVIGLERAVALGGTWPYLAPLLTGLGALAILAGFGGAAATLATAGSVVLALIFVAIVRRQPALFTVTMAAGAVAWLVGNLVWLGGHPMHRAAPWWVAFLVLTIAGERLELTRLLRLSALRRAGFLLVALVFALGLVLSLVVPDAGIRVTGAALLALSAWLAGNDIARRTVRQPGLTRFIAFCLLSGYVWLGAAGVLAFRFGAVPAGPAYDAFLHAVFVGFVFAMIFGHAPIIFPALVGWPMRWSPAFYAPLALLHATLVVRVAGDLAGWLPGRQWGGLLNAAAIVLFFLTTAASIVAARPRRS